MTGIDLTLSLAAMRLFAGLLIAAVQGATIAAAAVLLGDRGPRHDGRLTLLPFGHIDLLGLGSLILTGFGWSRPVAIDAAQLRGGRWGLVGVVAAGSLVLLALAAVLLLLVMPALTMLPGPGGLTVAAFLRVAARLSVWMALFTLLPLPPLAGAHLLEAAGVRVPAAAGVAIGLGLAAVSLLGVTRTVLTPIYEVVAPLVVGPDLVR